MWGVHIFTSESSVLMVGWIAEMLFMLFFAYIVVLQTKHNMYRVYWLMDVLMITP